MTITPAQLRAEGVIDHGFVFAVPYVRTQKRLVLILGGEEGLARSRDLRSAVPRMRELRDGGYTTMEIGLMYGVSDTLITRLTMEGGWTRELWDYENWRAAKLAGRDTRAQTRASRSRVSR